MERSSDLESLTRELYEAMERGDGAFLAGLMSHGDDVVMIGSDPREWWSDFDTITRVWSTQLDELGGVTVEDADPHAYASGDVGWMSDHPTFRLPDGTTIPFRLTGVYRSEDEAWRLVQGHASIGVANEQAIGTELTT